ncbi:hypothetical protein E3P92_03712 [Wallemia ichthyophaga]|uniref:Uncharacterized protein n=1 Tax=Wallemia ichthyophaga TaxID=245174 RepID=A0A4T0HUF3_WALIC|nr:hypothetical protein E3P91_03763 [Wallemia ichthyophaga]TIB07859.1 hypothetical protein E3P93_03722 [Wallemia ichthyophaga]TIB08580.1 hypothetical protein E3P90_03643 [Wallemia ichthyophaga]TIB08629.1 hypothetical protein E3P92_03712 [Wallemia ichthyophaga]TIB19859.1 hypothetical protein E3P89_03596 [Wallemia ichthyophaga]
MTLDTTTPVFNEFNARQSFFRAAVAEVETGVPMPSARDLRMHLQVNLKSVGNAMSKHDATVHFSESIGLQSVAHDKAIKFEKTVTLLFNLIIFSAGGVPNPATLDLFKAWKKVIPSCDHLMRLIRFALVRKRLESLKLIKWRNRKHFKSLTIVKI